MSEDFERLLRAFEIVVSQRAAAFALLRRYRALKADYDVDTATDAYFAGRE